MKKNINISVFKRILKYISKYKLHYFIIFICIIISSIVQVLNNYFLKIIIDDYITPLIGIESPSFIPLTNFLIFVISIYITGIIANYVYNKMMIYVSQNILKNIRDDMFSHLETLPISYFDKNTHGDIMSRFTNDTDSLEQLISQSIPSIVGSFISLITIFISMIILNIPLTLIVLFGIFCMLIVSKNIVKKSGSNFIKQQQDLGNINGYIEEMVEGIKVVKVFNHEDEVLKEFNKLNNSLYESASNANGYGNMIAPVTNNIGHIIYVFVALIGGLMAISSNVFTLGGVAAFLSLTNSFTRPIMQITFQLSSALRALAGANRIFNLMDEEKEENNGKVRLVFAKYNNKKLVESKKYTGLWAWKKDRELILLTGDVRMYNVDFSYEKGKKVIKNISLYAKPGQKIAFVGATGAGKTTISNLLNRFYDIDKGLITYDGIDIKDINKNDLRKSLGMVLQDTYLFSGTIMDNIRYGNNKASDEDCIRAARLANADAFIKNLPQGYNTIIDGSGGILSAGEKQLLSIARCAVCNPPAMILDEATSRIDTRTESIIEEGMDKLMEGRTVFVIAHRLSTIKNSKAIMVMENGCIIERGDHKDLIKEKGKYYELYTGSLELD